MKSMTRRNFVTGGVLGAAGIAIAAPSAAFAVPAQTEPAPSIKIELKSMDGLVVDSFGTASPRFATRMVKLFNTTQSITMNEDGSYTAACEASVGLKVPARTITDSTSYETGVTIKVAVMYSFIRGKITVQSGSVNLTNLAEGAVWHGRHLVVCQGEWASLQQRVEEFFGLEHVIITGFSAIDYIPSGSAGLNGTDFQGVLSANNMPEHLVLASVQV